MACTSNIHIINAPLFTTDLGSFVRPSNPDKRYYNVSLNAMKDADDPKSLRICEFVNDEPYEVDDYPDIFTALTSGATSFKITNKLNERYKSISTTFDAEPATKDLSTSVFYIVAIPFNGVLSNLNLSLRYFDDPDGVKARKPYFYNSDFARVRTFEYGNSKVKYGKIAYFIIKADGVYPLSDIRLTYTCTSCRYAEDGESAVVTTRDFMFIIEPDADSKHKYIPKLMKTTHENVSLEPGGKIELPKFSELFSKPVDKTISFKNDKKPAFNSDKSNKTYEKKGNANTYHNKKDGNQKPYNKSYDKKPRNPYGETFDFSAGADTSNKKLAAMKKKYGSDND